MANNLVWVCVSGQPTQCNFCTHSLLFLQRTPSAPHPRGSPMTQQHAGRPNYEFYHAAPALLQEAWWVSASLQSCPMSHQQLP